MPAISIDHIQIVWLYTIVNFTDNQKYARKNVVPWPTAIPSHQVVPGVRLFTPAFLPPLFYPPLFYPPAFYPPPPHFFTPAF